jgi:hypothetical protein
MEAALLDPIPETQRAAALSALAEVFGPATKVTLTPMTGGSSGALLYRAEHDGRRAVLRIEGPEKPLFKLNPHRWTALRLAAEAGVTPPLWRLDDAQGVSVSAFIEARPLATYPGGLRGLAGGLGKLAAELQATAPLPPLADYRELVGDMLAKVRALGVFAEGVLEPHLETLAAISQALDWEPEGFVSAHNDPNPGNIIFDGARLWLIDFESAYANDPLVDLAIMADGLAPGPELEDALLRAWLGAPPDRALRARFDQVRRLTRLYYGCFLVDAAAPGSGLQTSARPPLAGDVANAVARGALVRGSPGAILLLGKVYLEGFLTGRVEPNMRKALAPLI